MAEEDDIIKRALKGVKTVKKGATKKSSVRSGKRPDTNPARHRKARRITRRGRSTGR